MTFMLSVLVTTTELVSVVSKTERKLFKKTIRSGNYCRYDHSKLKGDLKNADWSPVYVSHSISDSLQAFNRILTEFFN